MALLFLHYPRCSTCQAARKWLDDKGLIYEARDIVANPPGSEELVCWLKISGKPLKRFFNTSGIQYRGLQLKEKLPTMSEDEQISLLSSNGMLVKRPILASPDFVLAGFRREEWEKMLA